MSKPVEIRKIHLVILSSISLAIGNVNEGGTVRETYNICAGSAIRIAYVADCWKWVNDFSAASPSTVVQEGVFGGDA